MCNLGPQTPVALLLVAVRSVSPTAVVLSSHTPTVASQPASQPASQAVRSVKAVAEAGIPVYFAGSSFSSQFFRQNTPGIPLDKTLREAADLIALRHSAPSHEPATVPRERAGSQPAPSPDPGARAPAPHRPRNVGEPTYGRQRPGAPRSSVTRRWVGRVRAT